MTLLDVLPVNPNAGIKLISNEVNIRSEGSIDEVTLSYFHEFLIDQLSSLKPQVEKGKFVNGIASSEYFQQLKRHGEAFFKKGGIEGYISRISLEKLKEVYAVNNILRYLFSGLFFKVFLKFFFLSNLT